MLDFLLVFHSDGSLPSATAILKAATIAEAKQKAEAIALADGRAVELWHSQRLVARFPPHDQTYRLN